MTEENYNNLKTGYLSFLKTMINESGGVIPHITVFGELKEEEQKTENDKKSAMIGIPLSPHDMENSENKEFFVEMILPKIYKSIKEKFNTFGIAYASEAWMHEINIENTKDPVTLEVLIISIDSVFSKKGEEVTIYQIERTGKQVTPEGDLVDTVNLKLHREESAPKKAEGIFVNLFKKLESKC